MSRADNMPVHGREGYARYYGPHYDPHSPDFEQCGEKVHNGMDFIQCSRKARCQPDTEGRPTRCKQHSQEHIEIQKRKRDARAKLERDQRALATYNYRLEQFNHNPMTKALQAIADGHNDPRSLAREALKEAEPVAPSKDT